ncbi:putative N-methylproline demethylase [Streptomyces griseorubiginosus]|uniref:N-methylproline demethylase n=2 Tax=Streptomyces griseorubiginosus TaxID=67304 RepID=A0AAI8L5K3_9ACTN|nr:putative N-methylproline demethylase [Streptomyces griseorubiginosus]
MLIMGETLVNPAGALGDAKWGAATSNDSIARFYERLVRATIDSGAVIIEQLYHPGGQVWHEEEVVALAPSAIPQPRSSVVPDVLTVADISQLRHAFRAAARRVSECGLSGVELKCDQGKLHHQFLSKAYNRRSDLYGGSMGNRMRFVIETLEEMRREIGDKILGVRLPVWSSNTDPASAEDLRGADWNYCAETLARSGLIDYISLSAESNSTAWGYWRGHPDESVSQDIYRKNARNLRKNVNIPILLAGGVFSIAEADKLVSDGFCDLVGMTRAHIADPHVVQKTLSKDARAVRPCLNCNQGCIGNTWYGRPVRCTFNAKTGRESLFSAPKTPRSSISPERVLVVGGGPCGLEFAAEVAERGMSVTIAEASDRLGGEMRSAALLPYRDRFSRGVEYLVRRVESSEWIDVLYETTATVELLDELRPDFVFIAVGARPVVPENLTEDSRFMHYASALCVSDWDGLRLVVVDSERRVDALGITELLLSRRANVECIVTPFDCAGLGMDPVTLTSRMARLIAAGVEVRTWSGVVLNESGAIGIHNQVTNRVEDIPGVDRIVIVANSIPDRQLIEGLQDHSARAGISCVVAGDAVAPRGLESAIREGHDWAQRLCSE